MRIIGAKLKRLAGERGVDVEQLAAVLPRRDGQKHVSLSERKVRNWLAGRDHPRCKPAEIVAMAQVLGADPKDISRFTSVCRFSRGSDRKANLVASMIRGRSVDEAEAMLEFSPKRAAVIVRKALSTATRDAENFDADRRRLIITESRVDGGPIIKRFQPKDRGRAHPISKRTSHIVIGVEEVA